MLLALITTAAFALTLPSDFDADMNMRYKERPDGRLHMARESSYLARDLVAGGSPEEIALAVKVLDAVIACHETAEDSPRRGNFWWYLQDGRVTDLVEGS